MSHLKSEQSGKSGTTTSPTIAFRFRSGDDELEELQIEDHENHFEVKGNENDHGPILVAADDDKSEPTSETTPVKEYWNLLGKRSTSVDSGCESPFPNWDPWRKFNQLQGKLTKTVEEKISEIKIERNKSGNVLGISNRGRLINSKDNSSISDSEDTSESCRLSESLHESEEENAIKKKAHDQNSSGLIDTLVEPEAIQSQPDEKADTGRLSDVVKLSDIKISMAKTEQLYENPNLLVESGIEADENFTSDARQGENDDDPSSGGGTTDRDNNKDSRFAGSPPERPQNARRWLLPVWRNNNSMFWQLMACAAAIVFYHVFPLSPFLKGLLTGILVMLAGNYVYSYVIDFGSSPIKEDYVPDGPFKIPLYELLKPLTVPRQTSNTHGVWFNEYVKEYDPDLYSVTQTVPVYLEINDGYLKLSRPKGKINKRATYDEPEYKLIFVSHRLYNISGCDVVLLPDGLTKKRLYSKKYPIVIMLKPDSFVTEKDKDSSAMETEADVETDPENTETDETLSQSHESSAYGRLVLNLFARCDRQKEEWYRKLLAATKVRPEIQNWSLDYEKIDLNADETTQPSTPFESVHFDQEEDKYEEYLRYMTQFVDLGSILEEQPIGQDSYEPTLQTQWFNAFVNRILFDVFRSPYWLEQIRIKMEKKLNSIRMPFYVEDIEIVELDVGKMGPRFHRISPPVLDDRGLWFDMDLTFDGLVKVTIQTQLNLIKLQKGMEQSHEVDEETLPPPPPVIPEKPRSPMYDSELEDSAESSDDEEEDEPDETCQSSTVETVSESVPSPQKKSVPTRKSSKKLFRIFENVAQSKYFKSVAQSKYIQKAIAGVSRTKLKLSLEIKGCVGTIAVNIPPPPSDRLWYGFREMPKVWLSAQPKIGEKHVRISHVKNFLEKKIMQEFKKVMVFPNMDDVILPTYPQIFNPNGSLTPTKPLTTRPIVPDLVTTPSPPPCIEINRT